MLSAPHTYRRLDLVAVFKELARNIRLGVKIADVNRHRKPNLFDFDNLLIALHFLFFFTLLVLVLAVIDNFAYGRLGVGYDFYQIQPLVVGNALSFVSRVNAELLSVATD